MENDFDRTEIDKFLSEIYFAGSEINASIKEIDHVNTEIDFVS